MVDYVVAQYQNDGAQGAKNDEVANEEAGDNVTAQESNGAWSWSISCVAIVTSLLAFGIL